MQYQTLTVQVEPDPDLVEVRELRGQKYLVAPVVAVSEGVLTGGFLPFEEIEKSAPGWNAKPVTVTHPHDEDGDFLPAAENPDTLERFQIGSFLNVTANEDGRSLDGEVWIQLLAVKWLIENDDELGDLAEQTVSMLRDGDPLEVSTGYWHGIIPQAGEFEGHEFENVQVDVLPDHLATLPNAEGACNWDGDRTESGCGAPRADAATASIEANARTGPATLDYDGVEWTGDPPLASAATARQQSFAANSATVATAQSDGIDAALHREGYDPASIDAANLLDTARVPEYEGTSEQEWSAPDLSDFVEAWGYDDVETVDDLTDEQKTEIAQTSLLGDSDADTFDELVFFPVVDPSGRDLVENALDAVLSGRGAQADISEKQLESARGVARDLLEDEFGRDLDDNADSLIDRVDATLASVRRSFLERLGFDVDDRVDCGCDGDCDDCGDTNQTETTASTDSDLDWPESNQHDHWKQMGQNNFDDDVLEAIANQTDMTVDELRDAPEKYVETLKAQVDLDGQSDGTGDGDGSGDGTGDQRVEQLVQKIEALEDRLDEQNTEKRERLIDAITSQTRFDEDDLESLGIADDVDKLEAFAEKQMVQVDTTPNYGGRAAGTDDDGGELEVEVGGYFTNSDPDEAEQGAD